jgi:hypothetical protein
MRIINLLVWTRFETPHTLIPGLSSLGLYAARRVVGPTDGQCAQAYG